MPLLRARDLLLSIRRLAPYGITFFVALWIMAALHDPLIRELDARKILAIFNDPNVWSVDHAARVLWGSEPMSLVTSRIGFPRSVETRLVAWVPAALTLPLRPFLGPLGAYNLVFLASPALSALAMLLCLRRVTSVHPWVAAGLSLAYALCPFALGCVTCGQIEKLQLWILPLLLLALRRVMRAGEAAPASRAWLPLTRELLLLASTAVAAAFTAPDLLLYAPLALAPFALTELLSSPMDLRRGRGLRLLAALLLLTPLLAGVADFYSAAGASSSVQAFAPGVHVDDAMIPNPSPVAQPMEILTGLAAHPRQPNPEVANHVSYLGWPILAFALLAALTRAPGAIASLVTAALGVLVSFGPYLVEANRLLVLRGRLVPMPALLLEALGYPSAGSGMYYRALFIASFGLCAAGAAGLARLGTTNWRLPLAVALAWGVGLGNVADGLRASAPLWPRPVGHVPYQGAWRDMASDPRPGAVLDLPVETTQYARGGYLLEALYHGRATTALPRAEGADFDSGVCRTRDLVRTAMDRGDGGDEATARAVVAARGFRYLVFHPEVPNQGGIRAEALVRAFGEPRVYSSLLVWTLDPGEVTGSDASASDRPPLDP